MLPVPVHFVSALPLFRTSLTPSTYQGTKGTSRGRVNPKDGRRRRTGRDCPEPSLFWEADKKYSSLLCLILKVFIGRFFNFPLCCCFFVSSQLDES